MSEVIEIPKRPARTFLRENFSVTNWSDLKPYFDRLLEQPITSAADLKTWLRHRSELESVISEEGGWRYIRMTCYTDNEDYTTSYQDFVQQIQPEIAPYSDSLNKKVLESAFLKDLEHESGYGIMIRNLKKEVELFREENIPLMTEITTETQKYAAISGAMMVELNGQELTLQQAGVILQSTDRAKREEVYHKISERRLKDKTTLDDLFTKLIGLRHQVACNADFENFRDYMFKAYGRFDYTPKDCFAFHEAIASEVVPILNELSIDRKEKLKVSQLRPWDKAVDAEGREALKAFTDGSDLTEKSIQCFQKLDPYLGNCLSVMKEMGHLDLESRKGKAPGGYNYPLAEIGVPFKSPPMEVAELASMSMELISMDQWQIFFPNDDELKRAKRDQLEDIIETLPWVATIDKFQHWIYENPAHTTAQRKENWNRIFDKFADTVTDWRGLQEAKDYLWQKQLHLYEVPFYYIEYGMAQLGAIAVWRNFKQNKAKGLEGYMNALKLGYLKTIPEIYEAANVKFDFSKAYIKELMSFVRAELEKLG
jgi:oligoendopeptidase F